RTAPARARRSRRRPPAATAVASATAPAQGKCKPWTTGPQNGRSVPRRRAHHRRPRAERYRACEIVLPAAASELAPRLFPRGLGGSETVRDQQAIDGAVGAQRIDRISERFHEKSLVRPQCDSELGLIRLEGSRDQANACCLRLAVGGLIECGLP